MAYPENNYPHNEGPNPDGPQSWQTGTNTTTEAKGFSRHSSMPTLILSSL